LKIVFRCFKRLTDAWAAGDIRIVALPEGITSTLGGRPSKSKSKSKSNLDNSFLHSLLYCIVLNIFIEILHSIENLNSPEASTSLQNR